MFAIFLLKALYKEMSNKFNFDGYSTVFFVLFHFRYNAVLRTGVTGAIAPIDFETFRS